MTSKPERTVLGFLFERRDQTTLWDLDRVTLDRAEPWRGTCAWLGNQNDKMVWIYVGLEATSESDFDDVAEGAWPLASAELSRHVPGAIGCR